MTNIFAQVGISTTSITPDATSILELRSTTLGFLAPRMTTTQRDAIISPATGLLIYNTTTNQLNYYSGSAWQVVTGGGQSQLNGTGFVKASGTTISYDNSTYLTSALTSFSKTDNYGITSSVTNSATTPTHIIGVDTTLISSRLWRQKGIDSLSAIIATKGTGTVTSVTSATGDATITNTTTTPAITIISAPKLTTARSIQGVLFDGTANINPINGTGFVKATGTTLSYDNSTYLTTAVTSFSKTDNYGITSSITNPTTTPTHTIGVDTTLISSRLWRQKGIDSLSAIIATKGTGTVTSVTSATGDATITNTTTTPAITIISAPKLTTARSIQGVLFDGTANINPINGTGFVKATGTTLSYDNSTYLTTAVTSFSKTDNYGITSSITNPTTTPTHTIGVDTTLISSRLWRQKGIDSLSAIIATKGTGTVTSVTSADANATFVTTTTTPVITIVSAPKLQTARTINGVFFDGSANITVPSGNLTGDVTSIGNATTLATVNSNVGTFNSVTVNAKGLVTGATITTSELTGKTNADVNSTYPDNATYFSNVTTANGFPANGNLNGVRKGTVNTQRMQDQLNGSTYARSWIEGTTSWTAWAIYLDANDFTAKGQMHIASGNNSVGVLSVGTDGQVLTADAASTNGVKWGTVTGTGNVVLSTSPTLITPNLGTPSTLVGTNITGTAAGLTAGNVTTNANLTGDVTSVGNATTIGSGKVTNSMLAGSIDLTTKVINTLPVSNGGTGQSAALVQGGIVYGASTTAIGTNSSGTAGQYLQSGGTGAPIWVSGQTIVTLGSDVVNNNATANTIADVTGLSFAVTAGVTYNFHALIFYTSAATTTGSRWAVNGPASPTLLAYTSQYTLTATTVTNNNAAAYDLPANGNASSAATTGNIAIIDGIIKPSANGTVIIRFASKIASSAITAKAGSTLTWW